MNFDVPNHTSSVRTNFQYSIREVRPRLKVPLPRAYDPNLVATVSEESAWSQGHVVPDRLNMTFRYSFIHHCSPPFYESPSPYKELNIFNMINNRTTAARHAINLNDIKPITAAPGINTSPSVEGTSEIQLFSMVNLPESARIS